jgi:hypothetical protein
MTEKIFTKEFQAHPLQVADVVSYLHENGWQTISHPNPRLLVFHGAADDRGKPLTLVLPSQNSFEDSPRLLAKAVNLLAEVEGKSPQEIVELVSQSHTGSIAVS